jgi:predicted transposase/invertase (TIGR01784 family)
MAQYLDPKNDLVFKKVFGDHPDLLISFLNALMPLPVGTEIKSLEYLPTELIPENPSKKYSVVDVRCKDNYDRHFIVEMQMYWTVAFMKRMLFNTAKVYVQQLGSSENYSALEPVYGLGLLNENFDRHSDSFYHNYRLLNPMNTGDQILGIEVVLIELQ